MLARTAQIRSVENWEQWLDASGRIFYYNPLDVRGQWVPPLVFEKKMQNEESKTKGRTRALKEDAAMRKLERNWENRTNVEEKVSEPAPYLAPRDDNKLTNLISTKSILPL